MKSWRYGILGLTALLLLQVGFVAAREIVPAQLVSFADGAQIPFEVNPFPIPGEAGACRQVFVCTVSCQWCARLADRISNESGARGPLWLVIGGDAERTQFIAEHGLSPRFVFSMPGARRRHGFFTEELYLPVTPLRLVWNGSVVVDLAPRSDVLADADVAAACAAGS